MEEDPGGPHLWKRNKSRLEFAKMQVTESLSGREAENVAKSLSQQEVDDDVQNTGAWKYNELGYSFILKLVFIVNAV